MPPTLYTTKEVADILRVSERTVRQLVHDKKIPHMRVGRGFRFEAQKFDAWVKNSTTTGKKYRRHKG